jgi:hypothetical protein
MESATSGESRSRSLRLGKGRIGRSRYGDIESGDMPRGDSGEYPIFTTEVSVGLICQQVSGSNFKERSTGNAKVSSLWCRSG